MNNYTMLISGANQQGCEVYTRHATAQNNWRTNQHLLVKRDTHIYREMGTRLAKGVVEALKFPW